MNKYVLIIARGILYCLVIGNVYYETGLITVFALIVIFACLEYDFGTRKKMTKHIDNLDQHIQQYLDQQQELKKQMLDQLGEINNMVSKRTGNNNQRGDDGNL